MKRTQSTSPFRRREKKSGFSTFDKGKAFMFKRYQWDRSSKQKRKVLDLSSNNTCVKEELNALTPTFPNPHLALPRAQCSLVNQRQYLKQQLQLPISAT